MNHVGDAVAVVIAETAAQGRDAAEKVKVDYEVLPAVSDPAKAKSGPQIHEIAPKNTIYEWSLGDQKAVEAAFAAAKHVTKLDLVNNRLVPNAIEPRAALAEYDAGTDHLTLWNTSQNPHVARLVISAFVGITPEHKLRVIAPDVGGGFGSKIFIYPEEVVCLWAARKLRRPVKWTADRSESFLTDAHGRDHVTHAELALDEHGKILALRARTIANLGAYMSTFSSSVPTYLYATLLSGQYGIPQIYCEVDAVYTNTVPVDAYRGAGRPEATFVVERLVETAARQMGLDPADLRKRNFIKTFPHQTPVIMAYDAGDYGASLKKAMELADVKGFNKRRRESARHGKLRGIGYSTYIEACGHRAQPGGRLARRRRRPVGIGRSARQPDRFGRGPDRQPLARPGARDDIRPARFANGSASRSRTSRSCTATPTRCSSAWAPTARAPAAVGMSAIVKALDKIEAKAKKVAGYMLEAAEGDIEFKDGKFTVAGTDKSAAWGDVALNAYVAHKFAGAGARAGSEGDVLLRSDQFHLPGRLPHLRGRGRYRHRQDRHRQLDRGRRLRHRDQPDDRGRPSARRHRARHRAGAAGRRGLRQRRPAGDRLDDGLHHAARARFAVVQGRPHRDQGAVQPARHQRLRRSRRDRGAGGGDQRHHRRRRFRTDQHAGHRRHGVVGAQARRARAPGGGIRRDAMYNFTFHRPTTVRQAAGLLARNPEGKLLAGGHSLLPVMKQRLAQPSALIDLALVEGMAGVEQKGRSVVIGAMTRHADAANSPVLQQALPGLAMVPASIGDPQVRNRGTIGGSIANNDPNADYPAAVLGLGATIITNKRRIAADDFFTGMFSTALEDGEIITKISFPVAKKAAYEKFKHPASGFALVGVFVSKRGADIRVAVTGAGANGVFRVKSFEEALKKRFAAKSLEGMSIPANGMNADIHGSAEYRAHLVGVLARRAVAKATA